MGSPSKKDSKRILRKGKKKNQTGSSDEILQ